MKLMSLTDIFKYELMDLLDAETQISKALIEVKKHVFDETLQHAVEHHYKQTQEHISRLKFVCRSLNFEAKPKECKGIKGIIEEGKELLEAESTPEALDAAIVGSLQRVEHYEIVAYGCVVSYAEQLGFFEEAGILNDTLSEEEMTDEKLSEIAESGINEKAMFADGGGTYVST